ncbi:MAG: AraC family transcriptional regulator [Chloracidobacterium sp.]|nr:AraC family transcriptional regulator [Chloracidobacterium sp.]
MKYSESKSNGSAAFLVKSYWELSYGRDEMSGEPEPVLPDGSVELIFDFCDRFVTYFADGFTQFQPRSIVAGQLTTRLSIGPSGDTDIFGVRLRPEAGSALLGISMAEIRDQIIDLRSILGSREDELFEKLAAAADFNARIVIFEDFFSAFGETAVSMEMRSCVSAQRSASGSMSVGDCAAYLNWSERRLERAFNEQIGLSPKLFARIIRFQTFLDAIGSNDSTLLDGALKAGYYDQAHMIKDFRNFSGVTPTEYFGRDLVFSGHFLNT